jgi:glycosyltransferase involved in cell wall biosynthesis
MKEYEQRFPNKVRCIWHKENLLQGVARNTGIRAACGEFVYFVDSDDYIDLTLCKKMYNAIIAENADMAVCDTNRIEKKYVIKNWLSNGNFNMPDLCERIKNIKNHAAWLIMIRKSIIASNNLYFPEYNGFEDGICSLWYLASKKITRINEALHYYYIRNNSIIQNEKLQTFIFNIQIAKDILSHDYFRNLDLNIKKSYFLYLIKWIPAWCQIVCISYVAEFMEYCKNILDMLKIYKVDYSDDVYMQSEEDIRSKKTLHFIEQNIDMPDFNLKFAAYSLYQDKIMQLRKMRRLISPYANKRLTLWGAGFFGKKNAKNLSILGIKLEITDANSKIYGEKVLANVAVKPWDEVKGHTDIVLVSVMGFFEDIYERLTKECPNVKVIDLIKLLE